MKNAVVAVVGDAGGAAAAGNLALAEELGRRLAREGFVVATGGMGGIMEAAARGAQSGRRAGAAVASIGILPAADRREANAFLDLALPTNMDHGRNQIIGLSDAVVAVGGGAGTLSEMCFGWIHRRLVVALRGGGWSGRLAGMRLDGRVRFADIADDRIFGAGTAAQAVRIVRERLPEYVGRGGGRIGADGGGGVVGGRSVEAGGGVGGVVAGLGRTVRFLAGGWRGGGGGLGMVVRHSVCGGEGGGLSEEGEWAARLLGGALRGRLGRVAHVDEVCARQTAELVAAGAGFSGEVAGGFSCGGGEVGALLGEGVGLAVVGGEAVEALVAEAMGRRLGAGEKVEFLEALFLWEEGGRRFFDFR